MAAQALGYTQPAITQQTKALEHEVGVSRRWRGTARRWSTTGRQ
ncbi:LysR family transcriptional regulator [Micromonospora sp. NPDC005806]